MTIEGTWQNSYGSVMKLAYDPSDGFVYGTYGSSTGSSGTYRVVGWQDPAPQATTGASVGLALFWRSIDGGDGDPSWHWVSAFGGQEVELNGAIVLNLVHDLVATDDFPAVANVGSYLDKLVYARQPGAAHVVARPSGLDAAPDPINGTWACGSTGATLDLMLIDAPSGYVGGTLGFAGQSSQVVGFVDSYVGNGALTREGVTLAALVGHEVVTFSGYLDLSTGALTLLQLQNAGTTPGNAYVQSNAAGVTFLRT